MRGVLCHLTFLLAFLPLYSFLPYRSYFLSGGPSLRLSRILFSTNQRINLRGHLFDPHQTKVSHRIQLPPGLPMLHSQDHNGILDSLVYQLTISKPSFPTTLQRDRCSIICCTRPFPHLKLTSGSETWPCSGNKQNQDPDSQPTF